MSGAKAGKWGDDEDLSILRQAMAQQLSSGKVDPAKIKVDGRTERGVKDRWATVRKECIKAGGGEITKSPTKRPAPKAATGPASKKPKKGKSKKNSEEEEDSGVAVEDGEDDEEA